MKILNNIFISAIAITLIFSQCKEPAGLSALVVSDQKDEINKDIQTILENTGLFDVDIRDGDSPSFEGYDVVVLNIEKGTWGDKTKDDFASYVKNGGGVVAIRNAGSAFSDWNQYKNIVSPSSNQSAGKSKEAYDYNVMNINAEHPITKGLHKSWMHSGDYLQYASSTLDGDVEVLANAFADSIRGGSNETLPVLYTVQTGDGRIFHSTLGSNAGISVQCVGFITTLQRGAEWAATGVVSQEAPLDFPNSVSTHQWVDFKPLTLSEIFEKASTYEIGKSKKYLSDLTVRIRNCDGHVEDYAMIEDKMLKFLQSEATVDSKKYMCRELSWMGSEKAVQVLEKLVNDKDLSESATYALHRLRL